MPLQATSGAASYDAFGGGVPAGPATYIEDVFSTYLYTGTGAPLTITNNIDLSTKGGMVWFKNRNGTFDHSIFDTARGVTKSLRPNETVAEATETDGLTAFNANGFTIGNWSRVNSSTSTTYVSWTFRKQPKFFDVVTYTGTGSARTVAHNLGSVPACILVKKTNAAKDWAVYHRSTGNTKYLTLNSTAAAATSSSYWNNTDPTSTVFTVGIDGDVNANGDTYVAYLFAHDAGGFGLTGTDNVISCGSFTTDGSGNATVSLGYEPQWVLIKKTNGLSQWVIQDTMRGLPATGSGKFLYANSSSEEDSGTVVNINATGFYSSASLSASSDYIYIAIRRGPMKVPTTGTSVFNTNLETTTTNPQTLTTGFPVDLSINTRRNSTTAKFFVDRLRGSSTTSINYLTSTNTNAESNLTSLGLGFDNNTGIVDSGWFNESGAIYWSFRRAPSFFDVVCYTGTGVTTTISHNLQSVPELMIIKGRDAASAWDVYSAPTGNTNVLRLSTTAAASGQPQWNSTTPTSTVFTVKGGETANVSGRTYVAYLFATCAGVSKVFSYTGNGSSQTINCGFTGGARFVMIKRTDSTGDWYVWDTARGIVSGDDPHLSLNTTAAEVTTDDTIDTDSTGFVVNQVSATNVNVSSASYIGLAIA